MSTSVPRPVRPLLCLLALAALLAVPAFAGETHESKASCALSHGKGAKAHAAEEAGAQQQAIADLRNVGTAMFSWYVDAMGVRHQSELPQSDAEPTSVRFDSVPAISHGELTKVLVPKYLAAVPEKDPWGNAYEYRLNTADLQAETIMALRTPGCDGKTAGETYAIGSFPAGDGTEDLVWMDGYFVRWPEAAEN